jgi:hypothetical protein
LNNGIRHLGPSVSLIGCVNSPHSRTICKGVAI